MSITVYAVKGEHQETCGAILCGLSPRHIQDILNVFRVKNASRHTPGVPRKLQGIAAPATTRRFGSSFLLRVGNHHAWGLETASIHDVGVSEGDDLVTGPTGFYVSVSVVDEECVGALRLVADALANQPVSGKRSLRQMGALVLPERPNFILTEWLSAHWDKLMYAGAGTDREVRARTYLRDQKLARREYVRRSRALVRSERWRRISRAATHFFEKRSPVTVELSYEMGVPGLKFVVEKSRFVPRSVANRVHRVGHRLGLQSEPQLA